MPRSFTLNLEQNKSKGWIESNLTACNFELAPSLIAFRSANTEPGTDNHERKIIKYA